ncbi:MAG: exosortase-associated EpsI family protein [Lentisphaerae bacterium]|nr:exosortase-associated EpsI family protein [Lentisphaerota bacterium]
MEKKLLTKHLILIAAIGAAILLAALTTTGRLDPSLPVAHGLPDEVASYRGALILYCQNPSCMHSFAQEAEHPASTCPDCHGAVESMALIEKQLLPSDTSIDRRVYSSGSRRRFTVSVVHGGYERRSIHKPQVCLVAQGNTITRQYKIPVPMPGDPGFKIMVMELNGSSRFFAYWFTDGQHETASHFSRLFWIAWDGLVHNERRRWAYISLITDSDNSDTTVADLKHFVRDLHPQLLEQP